MKQALSLFTSGGIGDLALRAAGFDVVVSNEKLADRHSVFARNFPGATVITGDIRERLDDIEEAVRDRLGGSALPLLYATPPCQGMSKNGRGKLLSAVRAGRKPEADERNRLILPTMELARRLQPEVLLFENVPEMATTAITDNEGHVVPILDYIRQSLGDAYDGVAEVVEFADYGVPQCRQRLITVFARQPEVLTWIKEFGSILPLATHSRDGRDGTRPWVTVRDAIEDLPPLDARESSTATSDVPFHRVPLLDETKYWWVSNTPPERSAFDNQCVTCGHQGNPTHSAGRDENGINRTSSETPLYCLECGSLLPRPSVPRRNGLSLMRGYTSAYKRMSFEKPASALTRNLSYACSDNKLHPVQNRVLSLFEAFRLHTVDQYDYIWSRDDGRPLSDKTIREVIGESIPPAGFEIIVRHMAEIWEGHDVSSRLRQYGPLFAS